MTVSVPFAADPNQVLEAFRRIQEEARKTGRELKSLGDIDLPGLEDARKQLEDMQRGFGQLFAPAVRGGAAEALRSGARSGMYQPDIVSWMQNAQRQFPDPNELNRHIQAVLKQSGRIAGFDAPGAAGGGMGGYSGPGFGAALGGIMQGNMGGVIGGALGGLVPLPGAAAIGSIIGGKLQSSIGKYADLSQAEAFGMTDLRRNVGGIGDSFSDFRKIIRDAGDGLATYTETLRSAQTYAHLSGAAGGAAVAAGTGESLRMARVLGLDQGQTASIMGRASWLGMGGGNVREASKMIAEAMAGSNLGGRQADAAEAMLQFVERQNQATGVNGNVEAFRGMLLTMYGSGIPGLKTNAANIIGGYDAAIKGGGMAGDAGKNFMYNTLSPNGKLSPFEFDFALEGGFFGKVGGDKNGKGGKMIGPALIDAIMAKTGGDTFYASASMKGLFGNNQHIAQAFIPEYERWRNNPNRTDLGLHQKYDALMKDYGGGATNEADYLRQASAHLENAATKLMGDKMLSTMGNMNSAMAAMTEAINDAFGGKNVNKSPGWNRDIDASAKEINQANQDRIMRMGIPSGMSAVKRWGLIGGDPAFDAKVSSMAAQYGVRYSSTMGADKIQRYAVTSGGEANSLKFVSAVDKLIEGIHQQKNIEVTVKFDAQGRPISGQGRISHPSHR